MVEKIDCEIDGTTPILFNRFRDVAIEGKFMVTSFKVQK